ncbi:hypothetical protein JXA32_11295 [Candidatus Sumerlaeota bacterium]|nr:hypothetical protein [Candidatus Sumerlaeota bacterium]
MSAPGIPESSSSAAKRPASRRKQILFGLVAVGFSLTIMLVMAELALNIAGIGYNYDEPEVHLYNNDPCCGIWYKPNFTGHWPSDFHEYDTHLHFNSQGLRGEQEYTPDPEPGVLRIAMLGDSYVRGLEVEDDETFCALMEESLNHSLPQLANSRFWPSPVPPRRVEVLNFGLSGSSPVRQASILKYKIAQLHPQLVMHFIFANDVPEDNTMINAHTAATDEDGVVTRWNNLDIHPPPPFWQKLIRRSHLVNFCYRHWRALQVHQEIKKYGKENLYYGGILHDHESDDVRQLWQPTEQYLKITRDICQRNHIA